MSDKENYTIIKELVTSNGVTIPVILLNGVSEVLEFDTYEEAHKLASLLELNSDSGWKYKVKKI